MSSPGFTINPSHCYKCPSTDKIHRRTVPLKFAKNYCSNSFISSMMVQGIYNYQQLADDAIRPRKLVEVENVKIVIDEFDGTLTIENVDYDKKRRRKERTGMFYQVRETKSLPKYVRQNDLYKQVKCKLIDGQVEVVWPPHKDQPVKFSDANRETEDQGQEIPIQIIDADHIKKKREEARKRLEEDKKKIREAMEKRKREKEKAIRRASSVVQDIDLSAFQKKFNKLHLQAINDGEQNDQEQGQGQGQGQEPDPGNHKQIGEEVYEKFEERPGSANSEDRAEQIAARAEEPYNLSVA